MEFKDIEYICAVARYRSITKAAEALYITQPTLSQYMKNMQKRLGIRLFFYEGNRIHLTQEGEMMAQEGFRLLNDRDHLINSLYNLHQEGRGILKIAIPLGRGSHLLPAILPEFYRRYPLAQVKLREGSSQELVSLVEKGSCDLVIINHPSFPFNLEFETIGYEKLLLVIGRHSPWGKKLQQDSSGNYMVDLKIFLPSPPKNLSIPTSYIAPAHSMDLPSYQNAWEQPKFIHQKPNPHTGQEDRKFLNNCGFLPDIILDTKNLEASYLLAASGLGMTFLSEYHIRYMDRGHETYNCQIEDPISNMEIIVGYKSRKNLSFLASEFLSCIKSYLSGHFPAP